MAAKKITLDTFVKGINITTKAKAKKLQHSLTFEKISLNPKQRDKILSLVEQKDPVRITIESMQDNLPGIQDE